MPATPCRGDVFHALHLVQPLATFLENRAYEAIAHKATLTHKSQKAQKARTARQRPRRHPLASEESFAEQLRLAAQTQAQAIDLAADAGTLFDWLRCDILSLAGADYAMRSELYDFVVAELRARQPLCPHRIAPVVSALTNQGDDLLAFAAQLDQDLAGVAHRFQLPVATVREVFNNEVLDGIALSDGPAMPSCGSDWVVASLRSVSPWPNWQNIRSSPVPSSRTSTVGYATISSSAGSWGQTTWPCCNSSSTTGNSCEVNGQSTSGRAPPNC